MDAQVNKFDADGAFDRFLESYCDSGKLAGLSALIWQGGEVAFFGAHGFQNLEKRQPMARDTILRIYSMTKPVASVAAMMLWEEGRFQLDDPLEKYLPDFADMQVYTGGDIDNIQTEPAKSAITIRQLLSHTTGFTRPGSEKTPLADIMQAQGLIGSLSPGTTAEIVHKLSSVPLAFHPGEQWRYSLATDVLGQFIMTLSGDSLDVFLRDRIFTPLGMNETGFHVPKALMPRFAANYGPGANPGDPIVCIDDPAASSYQTPPAHLSGGGGLLSTADDYLTFARMLLNGGELNGVRLLKSETLAMMTKNQMVKDGRDQDIADMGAGDFNNAQWDGIGFGLGFSVVFDPARSEYGGMGAYGWTGAASTMFWIDPTRDLIAMEFAQFMPSGTYPLRAEFRKAVYDALG
jgi:CubicO group peptidase (beta-lactamase class C family)